ncbi:hypothetical protein FOPG_15971 [Fusarium oxysporum f. sp. conglutinans race 2 54008]|uniref:Uncharacterized protein n=3 Tax=Fusarium oxysporum f. sp. conglutinans TaxID=100902 RepID=A0A8H6GRD4_FUSOX|nr:hypothetical protein FOXB_09467 [Fusarium oxysporum f. sp. conglutinans Fo5176]EXL67944.1 hypothetical protein FOPG_15971 [Fusarium oxysporum f. sp. conglutinans race 2 54008]KAF6523123.1 hypothetical protein HZS61_014651 [Fusarium oxysporum f. sp. conglutinans]KAG6987240.1 hypothetical protein FocnCong_v002075 [Fusarium oxysporum f. sp. conglutinans]
MDIELAVETSLKPLTLGEKALGKSLLSSQRVHGSSDEKGTVWLRAPKLVLAEALKTARDLGSQKKISLKFVHIFCDTLIIQEGDRINGDSINSPGYVTDGTFTIQIYARKLIAPVAGDKPSLRVDMTPTCVLVLWVPDAPSSFELDISVKSQPGATRMKVKIDPLKFGVSYVCSPTGEMSVTQRDPPKTALAYVNYLELINDDGTLQDQGYATDELPRLLQMQILVAQVHAETDRQFAIDLLNYVIIASGSAVSYQLHYQAVGLRNNLALGRDIGQASSVNVYASKQVLKARLTAALAFENAYRDYLSDSGTKKQQVSAGLDLLAKSNDALETYKFIIGIRQREYEMALHSNDVAKANFEKNNNDLASKIKAFEAGVEKYKKDQQKEATKSILKGVFSVVLAVGATIATAGAAAPSIVAAGAGVASSVEKAATLIQKLKAVYEKLKAIFDKIKPVIEKLGEIVETSKKMIEMINKLKQDGSNVDSAKTLRPGKDSAEVSDVGIAEWERFNITVLDMQDFLREYEIEGKREYFMSLKTLVISGECYIKTQANLVQKGDDLAILSFQTNMEDKNQQRLAAMNYKSVTDEKILDLLKRAMFDRILALRTFVYQDFQTYSTAYNYHSLSKGSLLRLSPVKPVVDYLEDAAVIQGAVVAYGSRVLVQSRTFRFAGLCGYATKEDLAAAFTQNGSVEYMIDPQDAQWRGFSRIRMSSARCYLDGVSLPTGQALKIQLKTSGRFFDRDCLQEKSSNLLVPVRAFVGDARTLLFEYNPTSKNIITDGLWGQERDYTKHTPMTSWNISIINYPGINNDASAVQVDFSGFSGITLEFTCDVVWTGY